MRTCALWGPVRHFATLALLGAMALIAVPGARTEQLPQFTGYTRPGVPDGKVEKKGPDIVFVSTEDAKEARAIIGGTVYFTVIDRNAPDYETTWKVTVDSLVEMFVPGRDAAGGTAPAFNGTASRYLYLYQIVNDLPKAEQSIRTGAVFLLDTRLVTSWGHFPGLTFFVQATGEEGAEKVAEKPVGRGILPADYAIKAGPKSGIVPVSADNPIDPENREYHRNDRAHPARGKLLIGRALTRKEFDTGKLPSNVVPANAEKQLDPVRAPDRVIVTAGMSGLDRDEARELVGLTGSEIANRPACVALWNKGNALRPGERSTLFGFTSPYPPTWEKVKLRGSAVAVGKDGKPEAGGKRDAAVTPVASDVVAAGDAVAAGGVVPAGSVPTPVPPPAAAAAGAIPGEIGGQPFSGGIGGGGFPAGGLVGARAPSTGAGGGFGGGGRGTPTQSQSQFPTQNQNQRPQQQQIVNVNQNLNNSQSQNQNQNQSQNQTNSNCCPPGEVVPEPTTYLMVLLGLPLVYLLLRRSKVSVAGGVA